MRYQQIQLTRLSQAKEKLVSDGAWHPFSESPGTFYRVSGRFMQRVRFEGNESDGLLSELLDFPPIPTQLLKEGFREEICFRIEDDSWVYETLLKRQFSGWEKMKRGANRLGAEIIANANTFSFRISIGRWETDTVLQALVVGRSCLLIASDLEVDARDGIAHSEGEIEGLLRTAAEVLSEEVRNSLKRKTSRKKSLQSSLFE